MPPLTRMPTVDLVGVGKDERRLVGPIGLLPTQARYQRLLQLPLELLMVFPQGLFPERTKATVGTPDGFPTRAVSRDGNIQHVT